MLMGGLATAVKYKLPVKVIIFNNSVLGMIKWEQIVMLGNPEFECNLQPIDFARIAEACGATSLFTSHKQRREACQFRVRTPKKGRLETGIDQSIQGF
jgi:thiamine pyrophosphate-dependent acetolactate synthase large subunit-like protein